MSGNSVTAWISRLKAGDPAAAQRIWERYCTRLVQIARQRLAGMRRVADEEDVVQEAFESFFRAIQMGKFAPLNDRGDLWRLLVRITENQAMDQRKHQRRAKRGRGVVRGNSVFRSRNPSSSNHGFDCLASDDPHPEFAVQVADELKQLLAMLDDPKLKELVLLTMAGYSRREIAERWQCTTYTVGRKLRLIRSIWTDSHPGNTHESGAA